MTWRYHGARVAALWPGRRLSRVEGGLFAGSELVRWALGRVALTAYNAREHASQ